jgi:hypothetical protein
LTGLINVGLYFLWTQVYEPWNLWQSWWQKHSDKDGLAITAPTKNWRFCG